MYHAWLGSSHDFSLETGIWDRLTILISFLHVHVLNGILLVSV